MTPRTTLPSKTNKYYLKKGYGGYSPCILGNSKHRYCKGSVLVNCVGWATGRFNEIGAYKKCKYLGNTNAENFLSLAKKQGLKTGMTPKVGACMVWAKGKAGVSSDGAGHVAIVEEVYDSERVLTSESGWSYTTKYFQNVKRTKGKDGRWGLKEGYTFLGFVYNPATEPVYYTVKRGDTLSAIAKKYNTTVDQLMKWNSGLIKDKNKISVGWKIRVK